jgi:hypothetical protein
MHKKQIVSHNPMQFMQEVVEAAQDGYTIDENEEFCIFYTLFSIGMCKADSGEAHAALIQPVKKAAGRPKFVN